MNILITGASRGLGFELVLQLVGQGHHVFALARSGNKLGKLQEQAKHLKGKLFTLTFDITRGNIDTELLPFVKEEISTIDILINNAGILINKPFTEIAESDLDLVLDTNFKAPFLLIAKLKAMMIHGSHIVNIGSMGGYQGSVKFPGLSAYSASKGALAILSECLAEEFKNDGIIVNCLALGSAQTEMLAEAFPDYQAPLSASEMTTFIADFAISGSKYFNGKVLPVSVSTP